MCLIHIWRIFQLAISPLHLWDSGIPPRIPESMATLFARSCRPSTLSVFAIPLLDNPFSGVTRPESEVESCFSFLLFLQVRENHISAELSRSGHYIIHLVRRGLCSNYLMGDFSFQHFLFVFGVFWKKYF